MRGGDNGGGTLLRTAPTTATLASRGHFLQLCQVDLIDGMNV